MFFAVFLIVWLSVFFWQFRKPEDCKGDLDTKDYVFYSNLLIDVPSWLVVFLFFNKRITRIPFTLIVGQIANYLLLTYFCIKKYVLLCNTDFYIPLLKFWAICHITMYIAIFLDHIVYCIINKFKKK